MHLIAHGTAGAAIGFAVGEPILGFTVGIASHFILDMVPHFDAGSYLESDDEHWGVREYVWATSDGLITLGLITLIVLRYSNPWPIIAGSFGAFLPDIVLNTPFWKNFSRNIRWLKPFNCIHRKYHWTVPAKDWLAGTIPQLVVIGGALWWLGL